MNEYFQEEFYDPETDAAVSDFPRNEFLQKYYDEVFSALLSLPDTPDRLTSELVPYEVLIFSDQPGVLRAK
ncbi:MAG: hypothetical protein LBQ83_07870 [Candidatus Margulisbacteria bacterium]|jgi:hypothetical protein|nr:hypothetical protein [Candidatus Margulisiibacteriota bacterium]